jgi:hypothetical protein
MKYPTDSQPIATITREATQRMEASTYELFATGELWTTGEHGYFAGYVSAPEHLDEAIDNHEAELSCMFEDARREFLPVPPRPRRPWRLYAMRVESDRRFAPIDWDSKALCVNLIHATLFSDEEKAKAQGIIDADWDSSKVAHKWVEVASAL